MYPPPPVNRKFISENLPAYLPWLSPATDSDTDLDKNVSIIIIVNIPRHNMAITY